VARIVHDDVLCEAHGVCTTIDPDRFELDDDDRLHIHSNEFTDDERATIEQAVVRCPRQALSISE
jgi:ferredoxin